MTRRPPHKWTNKEIALLIQCFPQGGLPACLAALPHIRESVIKTRLQRLRERGLLPRKRREYDYNDCPSTFIQSTTPTSTIPTCPTIFDFGTLFHEMPKMSGE